MPLISLKNIAYQYPLEERRAIRDVSCDFEEGKVYGLIGPNDSGKTTLCSIIRGFIPEIYRGKLSGEVWLDGKPLADYDPGELARMIGYSFQNPFAQISGVKETVYEEIAYGMENIGTPREMMITQAEYLLKTFHLEELRDKNPYMLSGGQKQRVALASVIALNPRIVILDEPTSQLDPQSTEEIFKIIKMLKEQGKTIILVEHKIDLIAEYCDYIYLMYHGKIAMRGKTREVLTDPKVLDYGGALPQVVLYFLERMKNPDTAMDFKDIPLTVDEAYQYLKEAQS